MNEKEIIVGIHSITCALKNPERKHFQLVASESGLSELRKKPEISRELISKINTKILTPGKLQSEAQKIYSQLGHTYSRIPSQIFLITSKTPILDISWIHNELSSNKAIKIFCLDSVTDVHNAAAIMRTAAFFSVDCLIISEKGNFGIVPSFSRIASGALEYVKIVKCQGLPRTIDKLQKLGIRCIGFSEHAEKSEIEHKSGPVCLVMGAEDRGLSHAVQRIIGEQISLKSQGKIKSLNVSVASAIAMEKFFS